MINRILALVMVMGLAAACNARTDDDSRVNNNPPATDNASDAARTGYRPGDNAEFDKLSPELQTFVRNVTNNGIKEVDLANLAQEQASNAQVREYAEQLEQDHDNANRELKRITGDIPPPAPDRTTDATKADERKTGDRPTMTAEHGSMSPAEHETMMKMREQLASKKGAAFDREYISMMVQDHEKAVSDFERASQNAGGDLKEWIDKQIPVLRDHLTKAQDLQKTIQTDR